MGADWDLEYTDHIPRPDFEVVLFGYIFISA